MARHDSSKMTPSDFDESSPGHRYWPEQHGVATSGTNPRSRDFEAVLDVLRNVHGFDFAGYKHVDPAGTLSLANPKAIELLGLSPSDIGRRLVSQRLGRWGVDLQCCIDDAIDDGQPRRVVAIERVLPRGDRSFVDIQAAPVKSDGMAAGALVTITDATDRRRLRGELHRVNLELEAANDTIATTQADLAVARKALDELGTTNHQLRRGASGAVSEAIPSRGIAKATFRQTTSDDAGPTKRVDRGSDGDLTDVGHVEEVR